MDKYTYGSTFENFRVERMVSEPYPQPGLFDETIEGAQGEQLKIFHKIENRFSMLDGSSFSDQVHFQNAYKTPVQRWFPYREGYSTRLVDAFINELKITGIVFDPFSGSGTTLMSARTNNLASFGVDVNPISVLVSRVENENYCVKDIKNMTIEIKKFLSLTRSNKNFETPFYLARKVFNNDILQSLLQIKKYVMEIESEIIRNLFFVAWLCRELKKLTRI